MASSTASVKYGEPWFSRSTMSPELEKYVFSSNRKVFYDENGEDLRLKHPGFKWSLVSEKRHDILEDCTQQFTDIFDEFYEKITGRKSNMSKRKSSILPILPSMKTPGLSRHRSKITTVAETSTKDHHVQQNVKSSPSPNKKQKLSVPPSSPQVDENPQLKLDFQEKVSEIQTHEQAEVNLVIEDVTNVRRSTRVSVSKKPTNPRKTRNTRNKKQELQDKENIQTTSANTKKQNPTSSSDDDFVPFKPRPARSTRSQTRRTTTNNHPCESDLTATGRVKRTRACKTSTKKVASPVKQDPVSVDSDSPVIVRSSSVGVDSDVLIKVKNNRLSKKLSISRASSGGVCRVSVEKLSVRLSSSGPISTNTPEPSIETNVLPLQEQPEHTHTTPQVAQVSEMINTNEPTASVPLLQAEDDTTSSIAAQEEPVIPQTNTSSETESDVEASLARPTPPRRKMLKLKKKTGKRGGRKQQTRPKTRAAELKQQASSTASRNIVVVEDIECDAPVSQPDLLIPSSPVVPPSISSESMYESCISEMGTPPTVTKHNTTVTLSHDIGSTVTKSSATTMSCKTPPNCVTATPPTITKHKPTIPQHNGSTVIKSSLPKTPSNEESIGTDKHDASPPSPTPPTPKESPMSNPSYLTGTPRTILKLREEYQSRTGGKLVSLSELLNSGGRGSPSLKKPSQTPKETRTSKKGAPSHLRTPSKGPNTLHTAKTPLLTHSKNNSKLPKALAAKGSIAGGKRLRSVSLEKLTDWPGSESRKRTSSSETSDDSSTDPHTETDSPDSVEPDTEEPGHATETTAKKTTKSRGFFFGLFGKKSQNVTEGASSQPVSFLQYKSPNDDNTGEGSGPMLSFLPRKSPKKTETYQEKQALLADKIQRKKEEEERRKEDLKNRRQLEITEKIKKREERVRRVAEKQAALRREEEEKKLKIKGQQGKDQTKKVTQKKAKEMEEKNKKLKERMMAAEARRKQEEAQQQKRLQQLEEERRMLTEMAQKRKEYEEEEKRLRRQEKQRQDRERQLKHAEELKDQQLELKRRLEEDEKRQQAEASKISPTEAPPAKRHNDLMKQFEKLMGGAIAKVPVLTTPKVSRVATSNKTGTGSGEKTNRFLQDYYHGIPSAQTTGQSTTSTSTSVESKLNSTFTKDSDKPPVVYGTPVGNSQGSKMFVPTSYEMTPADKDPLFAYDNYDIENLSSGDSTDDEECPKKVLPLWARPDCLNAYMRSQEDDLKKNRLDISKIFPPEQLLLDPDLAKIFRRKRQRFYQRSSSAHWDSPMMKKNRLV